jgi:cytochrome c peroxidase
MIHPRSSQALINTAYYPSLTWANPALNTIEKQLEGPLFNETPIELGINDINRDEVLRRFSTNPLYQELFKKAYPDESEPYRINYVINALASFVRTLNSFNSAFDKYQYGGDKNALSQSAKRGMDIFFGEKAECFHCHSGFNFTDSLKYEGVSAIDMPFHNTGLYNVDALGSYPSDNTGVFEITNLPKDMGRFRAPTLRNIEFTAPYMHDGSLATLKDVLDFYSDGGRVIESGTNAGDGRANPHKSDLIVKIGLTEQEKLDIIEFLKSLSDYEFINNPKISNPFEQR